MQQNVNSSLSLEQVKLNFTKWRKSRSKVGRIPDALWAEVLTLLKRYKISHIRQSLGISSTQLKRKLAKVHRTESEKFVEVTLAEPSLPENQIPHPESQVVLSRADGARLKICGIHVDDLRIIVSQFLRSESCYN